LERDSGRLPARREVARRKLKRCRALALHAAASSGIALERIGQGYRIPAGLPVFALSSGAALAARSFPQRYTGELVFYAT